MKSYTVNEIFFSLQGEGIRAGSANLFLRLAGCNVGCQPDTHGFECDTDYTASQTLTLDQIISTLQRTEPNCPWVVLTGGEPALQVDRELIDGLHDAGYKLAIETNGTIQLPVGIDWITVSPKVEEDQIRQRTAHEVKYVRPYGYPIPQTAVEAEYKVISPVFKGQEIDQKALEWCIKLVRDNPQWRLAIQMHKLWRIR